MKDQTGSKVDLTGEMTVADVVETEGMIVVVVVAVEEAEMIAEAVVAEEDKYKCADVLISQSANFCSAKNISE